MTTDKVLDKLQKLIAVRDSEKSIGNIEAAESFAAMINKLLLQHELDITDVDLHASKTATEEDPIIEHIVNLEAFGIQRKSARSKWQEALAGIVAKAHMCRIIVFPGSNRVAFVGTKTNTTVAEYAFGTLVPVAKKLASSEDFKFRGKCRREDGNTERALGFRAAWLTGFVRRIGERLQATRDELLREQQANAGSALIRLDNAMARSSAYVLDKYKKNASGLRGQSAKGNGEAYNLGRAAADRLNLGVKGVGAGSKPSGLLR